METNCQSKTGVEVRKLSRQLSASATSNLHLELSNTLLSQDLLQKLLSAGFSHSRALEFSTALTALIDSISNLVIMCDSNPEVLHKSFRFSEKSWHPSCKPMLAIVIPELLKVFVQELESGRQSDSGGVKSSLAETILRTRLTSLCLLIREIASVEFLKPELIENSNVLSDRVLDWSAAENVGGG